jgi:hypothetical protein
VSLVNQGQLPGQVLGVADAGEHALPARRAVDVGRIAGEQDAPAAVVVGQPSVDAEVRRPSRVAYPHVLDTRALGE